MICRIYREESSLYWYDWVCLTNQKLLTTSSGDYASHPYPIKKSDTNNFGVEGVFELDLGDSEIPLTPNPEREQKLLKEQLKKKDQ